MKIYDFVDQGLGHSSYLIDVGDGTAAIIDPPRLPSAHEALACEKGLRIAWTVDTHSHARAMTAASLLTANDCSNVSVFNGGPDTWSEAAGYRLQTGP